MKQRQGKGVKIPPYIFNAVFPVTKAIIYKNGMVLKRESQLKYKPETLPTRGKISKMSKNSLARLIVMVNASEANWASMLTLTYPKVYPKDGEIIKSDLSYFCTWLKRTYDCEYLWFLEFQQRGAPHFHILLTTGVDGISPKMRANVGLKWTERIALSDWFQVSACSKEMHVQIRSIAAVATHPKTWELIRETNGGKKYATKYAAKEMQKKVPDGFKNVGRFWGMSKEAKPKGIEVDITDDEVREFLQETGHKCADWEILPKYLFNLERK